MFNEDFEEREVGGVGVEEDREVSKDYGRVREIAEEIFAWIRKSKLFSERSTENEKYLVGLLCPQCGKEEAYVFKRNPTHIICPRKNNCGARTRILPLFLAEQDVETRFPPTTEDPHRPARIYLERRGLQGSLEKLDFYYEKNVRGLLTGAVMFPLFGSHEGDISWNGRLFSPPPGEGKTHNIGSTKGLYWKHPGIKYDPDQPTYVTEGIINALSLIEMGYQALAVLSAGSQPSDFNFSSDYRVILAFDNDKAGKKATKGWKAALPDAGAILPSSGDWNDFLCRYGESAGEKFKGFLPEFKFQARLALAKDANDHATIFLEQHNYVPGLFDFGGEYYYSELKVTQKGAPMAIKKVSNFILEVRHFEVDRTNYRNGVYYYQLRVFRRNGKFVDINVRGDELGGRDALRKIFLKNARAYWAGSEKADDALRYKILKAGVPEVRKNDRVGHDLATDSYYFQTWGLDSQGYFIVPDAQGFFKATPSDYVLAPAYPTLTPIKGKYSSLQIYHLLREAWGERAAAAVAFMVATWFVNRIKPRLTFFPFLSFFGDTQTGKTRLVRFLNAMQALDEEGMPLTQVNTRKGEIRKLSQVSGLFKALLEGNSRDRFKFDYESILTLYNWGNSLQVRAQYSNDNQTNDPTFLTSLIFVQNRESFDSKAARERIISLEFSQEDINQGTRQTFEKLASIPGEELAYFIVEIMRQRQMIESEWFLLFNQAKGTLEERIIDPRLRENHALILCFHILVCRILGINMDLTPYIIKIAEDKYQQCLLPNLPYAELFFETLLALSPKLLSGCCELEGVKGELFVHLPGTLQVLHTVGQPFQGNQLYGELSKHPAYIRRNHPRRLKGGTTPKGGGRPSPLRCWVFDYNKLVVQPDATEE